MKSSAFDLLDATVSKTILWCAESWKLTVEEKKTLRITQRSMLRRVVGPRRNPEEDYLQWIRRATRIADGKARDAGVRCWVESFLSAKWQWAGKVMNMQADRWASRTTLWRDSSWCSAQSSRPLRTRLGRHVKWEEDLRQYASTVSSKSWQENAQDSKFWHEQERNYLKWGWR